MARVLIIGPGDMGHRLAAGLGVLPEVREIVLAGLGRGAGPGIIGMVSSTCDVVARFEGVDCTRDEAVADLLERSRPDVVVQCATLLSPWALGGRTDPVARAMGAVGLGAALAMQLPVALATMRAVRATGYAGPVANLSFPDVANVVLGRLGLAPTCGLGNVTMHLLRVRGALRAELGPDAELPLLRLLGHHNQVYAVMRADEPADPAERVRVHVGEEGARRDDLAYRGHPFAAGVVYNEVTAAAVVETVAALLPGAGRTRLSVPAPFGLPGGYPVAIEDGVLELDLPPGVQLDEAVAWNAARGCRDGVAEIAQDGTVTFTDAAREAVAGVAPWLTASLHPDEVPERAARMRALIAG